MGSDTTISQGRLNQVSTQPASGTPVTVLANQFTYYPHGPINSFTYGNTLTLWQTLNQDYRLGFRFDGPELKGHAWHLDGTLKRRTTYGGPGPAPTYLDYGYDATGRLVSAIDSAVGSFGTLGYSYDKNGNRLSETRNASVLPYTYSPAGSNWLYQKGSDIRGKTLNGNTASMSGATFTYDGYNRLATSTTAAETTTYTYNALGERIKKINQNGLATSFHYGHNGELLYERDQAGNTKAYVWLDGRPLARIDNDSSNAIYYYHVDHLGTPQAMTNSTGATVWKADYEPFGKATVKVSTIANNLRLPGQYFDKETGLHYNYYRSSYDPGTGRYGEFDPIGLRGGLNGYAYANGNPLRFIDPEGLAYCWFSISSGRLLCISDNPPPGNPIAVDIPIASGNNGNGTQCKNNSGCTQTPNRGPIPQGVWTFGGPGSSGKENGRRLTPQPGTNNFGRTLLASHSCFNAFGPSLTAPFCSEGCITGSPANIQQLNQLIDAEPGSTLLVTD